MGQTINEGLLKKRIIYILAFCRLVTLIILYLSWQFNSLIETPLYELLRCLLPLTVLCLFFILKYLSDTRRYIYPGKPIHKSYSTARCLPLIVLNVAEGILILLSPYLFDQDMELLYWFIAIIECLLAAYAGFYLSVLFGAGAENAL